MADFEQHIIELELTPKLKRIGIVESFIFNTKTNSVKLSLNHAYNGKVVICPINNKNWIKTTDNFKEQLKKKGVSKDDILALWDSLDLNFEKILDLATVVDSAESEEKQEERIEDTLMDMYHFKTMSDTKEIYYYDDSKGIYISGAEIIIESQAESITDGTVSTSIVNEAMNHIRRRTYTNRAEFDTSSPHIVNLQNGLLDIDTLELKEQSPDQLSLVQLPVKYDPKARCPKFAKFLGQVLYWKMCLLH